MISYRMRRACMMPICSSRAQADTYMCNSNIPDRDISFLGMSEVLSRYICVRRAHEYIKYDDEWIIYCFLYFGLINIISSLKSEFCFSRNKRNRGPRPRIHIRVLGIPEIKKKGAAKGNQSML